MNGQSLHQPHTPFDATQEKEKERNNKTTCMVGETTYRDVFSANQDARHHGADDKRKIGSPSDAVDPSPPGAEGCRDQRVERSDGKRHDRIQDAVGRRGFVAVLD